MNQVVKQKWIDSLKSGNYKQGSRYLRNPNTGEFCCLGVLCDIYLKEKKGSWNYFPNTGTLPEDVQKWANLESHNPKTPYGKLSVLNDISRVSFAEIAHIIEENL